MNDEFFDKHNLRITDPSSGLLRDFSSVRQISILSRIYNRIFDADRKKNRPRNRAVVICKKARFEEQYRKSNNFNRKNVPESVVKKRYDARANKFYDQEHLQI